jgi:hypothetical protein
MYKNTRNLSFEINCNLLLPMGVQWVKREEMQHAIDNAEIGFIVFSKLTSHDWAQPGHNTFADQLQKKVMMMMKVRLFMLDYY